MRYYISYLGDNNKLNFEIGTYEELENKIIKLENECFEIIDYPALLKSTFIKERIKELENILRREKEFLKKIKDRENIIRG